MNTKKTMIFVTSIFCVLLTFGFQSAPQHELLFEKAKFTMETKGDLKGAVVLFQEIIDKYPGQRQYAAKSHFYIGFCYEKLGYTEAVKAYELVLEKYADQPEQVAAARARLAALRAEEPGGLTLTKIEGPEGQYLEIQSLSPDGTKMAGIIYNQGQNLAVYDLVTKRLDPVTQHDWSKVTYFAIWSPDGKKIAYLQYGAPTSIMVSTLGGKAEPIFSTEKGRPVPYDWLPDGSAVVATLEEGEDYSLGLVPIGDGAFKALHALKGGFHADEFSAFADASPDGRHIVFADGSARNAQNIFCMSTDGQTLEVLADHRANDIQPRWSPDGDHVVFLSFRSGAKALWGVRVQDGRPAGEAFIIQEMGQGTDLLNWTHRGLAYQNRIDMWDMFAAPVNPATGEVTGKMEQMDYSPPGRNRGPVWSPDGKQVAFFAADRGGQPGKGSVVVMPAQGGNAREYPAPMEAFHMPNMIGLRWMPDSSGVGFYGVGEKGPSLFRLTVASEKWETWKVPLPGWTRIEWGPDGSTYFYTRNGGKGGILERNLETGEERYVYGPEKGPRVFRGLRFSRDYKKLVVHIIDIKNNWRVVVVDLESGEAQKVFDFSDGYCTSAWSADGQNLMVLRRTEDESQEMFIIPAQGGNVSKLELPDGPAKARRYLSDWSPDGRHIAFGIRQIIYETFVLKNLIPKK